MGISRLDVNQGDTTDKQNAWAVTSGNKVYDRKKDTITLTTSLTNPFLFRWVSSCWLTSGNSHIYKASKCNVILLCYWHEENSIKATDYTTQTSGVNHIWPMQRRIIPNLSEDIPYFYFKRLRAEWKVRNVLWFSTKFIHISKIQRPFPQWRQNCNVIRDWFKFRSCVIDTCYIDISYTYSIQKI